MSEQRNLTKRVIEALLAPSEGRVEYRDTAVRHLRIVVSSEDRRTWRYVRKVAGRTRKLTLGTFPDTTPDMARRESKRLSAEYDAGRDPAQEKKKLKDVQTWADLFEWYMDTHARPHKKTWKADEDMNRLYCSKWTRKPYTEITADTVTRWHKHVGQTKGKHAADRALAMVKTVFARSLDAEVIVGKNPASPVRKFHTSAKQYGRDRFLSGDELGRLLKALSEHQDQDMADYFMVSLFTGARRGNVQSMQWSNMDRSDPAKPQWRIPSEDSKNKEPMKVAIVEPVISILNRRRENVTGNYVFPAKRSGSKTPHITEPKKAWATICKRADLQDVRIHDLRRTLGSWQALLGSSLQVIGKSLGHKSMQSTEIYARLDQDPVTNSVTSAATAMLQAAQASKTNTEGEA
jgi:integrase